MNASLKAAQPTDALPFARAAASGAVWLVGQSLSVRIVSLLGQVVLAWLLLPSDFGNVGLALTVASFAGTLVNFGIDDVLLQRHRTLHLWLRSAIWLSLSLGLASMLILILAAPSISALFGSPAITPLVYVLAIAIPFGSLATVPIVVLRANLNFRFLALCAMAELITLQIATVGLAWAGAGQMSFVIPVPFVAAIKAAVLWWWVSPSVSRRVRPSQVGYFISYGSMVTSNRMITVAMENGDYIVLGLMTSPEIVGLYFFAFRLAAMPVRTLAASIQQVMLPILTKLRAEPERQERAAFEASRLLAYTAIPLCFLQAAASEPLLLLTFGEKWHGAIPLAQILSLGLPFDAICWVPFALLSARGEFRRSLLYMAAAAASFFAFVSVGAIGGAIGVAIAAALFYALMPLVLCAFIFRSSAFRSIALVLFLPAVLAGVAATAGYTASLPKVLEGRLLLRVVVIVTITASAYPILLRLFAPKIFAGLLERARGILAQPQ